MKKQIIRTEQLHVEADLRDVSALLPSDGAVPPKAATISTTFPFARRQRREDEPVTRCPRTRPARAARASTPVPLSPRPRDELPSRPRPEVVLISTLSYPAEYGASFEASTACGSKRSYVSVFSPGATATRAPASSRRQVGTAIAARSPGHGKSARRSAPSRPRRLLLGRERQTHVQTAVLHDRTCAP